MNPTQSEGRVAAGALERMRGVPLLAARATDELGHRGYGAGAA